MDDFEAKKQELMEMSVLYKKQIEEIKGSQKINKEGLKLANNLIELLTIFEELIEDYS